MIKVLCIGGVGESSPDDTSSQVTGMLAEVTKHLDDTMFDPIWIPWISEYGPAPKWDGISYDKSVSIGENQVRKAMDVYGDSSYILLGYSGGAHIAGNVADNNPRVLGVGLIADPMRQRSLYTRDAYGILGERVIHGTYQFPIANPWDIITACPTGSPLRTLGDVTKDFSISEVPAWGRDLHDMVWQEWWKEPFLDWASVVTGLAGYLAPYPWSQHTGYDHMIVPGTDLTYCQYLAQQLNGWDKWNEPPPV